MADLLDKLPTDSSIPNHQEIQVVNELFKKHDKSFFTVVNEFKNPLICGLVYIILALPISTNGINYLIPSIEKNPENLFMILIKTLIFVIIIYYIQNYKLFMDL